MSQVLLEELETGVGLITFNDPESLNAMGETMAKDFAAVLQTLRKNNRSYRALVVTGAGRAFSAGGDLEMLEGKTKLSGEENRQRMLQFYDSFLSIHELGIPLIAAINGHAVGAGLCVACACDIRIASERAKLGFTFTKLGLYPGMGATYFLPRILGAAAASELLLTGRMIDAPEAFRLGLISKVCPEGTTQQEALNVAREIKETGSEALRQLLMSLRSEPRTLAHCLEQEALCQAVNYASEEFKEGIRAVREKRKANFNGA